MRHGDIFSDEFGQLHKSNWVGSRPWGTTSPVDEMEMKEDGWEKGMMEIPDEAMDIDDGFRRGWIQNDLLVYLFADGNADRWQDVTLRALAVMRRFCPVLLVGRAFAEVEGLRERSCLQAAFPLGKFDELTACEEREALLTGLLGYLYPSGSQWLKRGTMRVYLLARTFQPLLLRCHGTDPGYERLEEIFQGRPLKTQKERDRARSRWSARAQKLIRQPVEANGGRIALQYGKSATARANYSAAAKGNGNRRGKVKEVKSEEGAE